MPKNSTPVTPPPHSTPVVLASQPASTPVAPASQSTPTPAPTPKTPTVFLGMSGGVDSSVAALLLQQRGYRVVGVYMKNWSRDLPGMQCPWAEDLADAKRVAVKLGIDFRVFDFEAEYKNKVVQYLLDEVQAGRTPNPDIMCNQEIKFKLFYETAREQGADLIATGHYAGVYNNFSEIALPNREDSTRKENTLSSNYTTLRQKSQPPASTPVKITPPALLQSADPNKDQTYFLYRVAPAALARTLFPVGHLTKPEVKALAEKHHLSVAHKKESMGICFVGDVSLKDFLKSYLPETPGEIREAETDRLLGHHEGAVFYTIGQRHGLNVGGGLPYYVVKKNIKSNIVYVSKNLNHHDLWTSQLTLEDVILRNVDLNALLEQSSNRSLSPTHSHKHSPEAPSPNAGAPTSLPVEVRLRHRAPLLPATLELNSSPDISRLPDNLNTPSATQTSTESIATASPDNITPALHLPSAILHFPTPVKAPAPGQSAVVYQGEICLGGGIIA